MIQQASLLLLLDAWGGLIAGRTTLQKRIYFLGELLDQDFGFGPHYYGPYSPQIESAMGQLVGMGLVREVSNAYGGTGQTAFERRRYDYQLTEDGKTIIDEIRKDSPDDIGGIVKSLDRIKAADDLDYMTLSIAAKAHYILKAEGVPMHPDDVVKHAAKFGWDVEEKQLDGAAVFLQQLRLIQRT